MGKIALFLTLGLAGLAAYIFVYGAPETEGHGVDPDKAVDAAGKATEVAGDYAKPWYDYVSAQAWFGTAVFALVTCIVLNRIWRGMNVTAKIGTAVVAAIIGVLVAVGLNK